MAGREGRNVAGRLVALKKDRQVLGHEHVLVEIDFSDRDLEAAVVLAPEHVAPFADEEVGLGFGAVAIDDEAAARAHLAFGHLAHLQIGKQVAGSRDRLLVISFFLHRKKLF